MPIYVDDPLHSFRGMIMCHMVSPDIEALHEMADLIGMSRRWFQDPRTMPRVSVPHYDIPQDLRLLAITAGAIEVNKYQMSVIARLAFDRLCGTRRDPLAMFRAYDSKHLPVLEAWLESQGYGYPS